MNDRIEPDRALIGTNAEHRAGQRSAGLVGFKKQRENILIPADESALRRLYKMRRMVIGASKGIESALQADGYRYRVGFVTLTYAQIDDWSPNDIKELIRHYRL